MNWIKKNWHLLLGAVALVTASIILFSYNNSGEGFWLNLFQSIYYSLTLIFLEGGNFAFPSHAPLLVKIILWICYFAAPLLTLTFLLRYMQERFFNFIPRRIKNHIVICGLGRNGKLIYDLVSKKYPNKRIVIIEKDETNSYSDSLERHSKTWWLKKDFTDLPVLQKAMISKADKVYITTNNDMANITSMMNVVKESSPDCSIYCHIGDIRLYSNVENVVKNETDFSKVKLFNGYEIATESLFKNKVEKEGHYSGNESNIFVFFGFGRFGQMLYNYIVKNKFDDKKDRIIILSFDKYLLNDSRNFTWTIDKPEKLNSISTYLGDMNDHSIWDKISESIKQNNCKINLFGCRDSDIANINLAISLMNGGPGKLKKGVMFCRTYSDTPQKLEQMLHQSLTDGDSDDVILFPVYKELKKAFESKLF